ncbi:MAG: ATP-binding protein [Alkalispirochaeta sp.]
MPYSGGGPRLIFFHLTYPLAMLAAVAIAVAIGDGVVRNTADATYRANVETVAHTVRNLLPPEALHEREVAQEFARRGAGTSGTRITIIAPDGTVLGDSHADPAGMENHAVRPEIRVALGGELGVIRRYSSTVNRHLVYAAVPVRDPNTEAVEGVVRASLTVRALSAITQELRVRLGIAGIILILAALVITGVVSELIRRPLKRLHTAANALASNPAALREFPQLSTAGGPREISQVARAFETLTRELTRRLKELDDQRRETEEVLNMIREPLLVLDDATRILRVNDAATVLAAAKPEACLGRTVLEVFRNSQLDQFVRAIVDERVSEETRVVVHGSTERHLQVWGVRIPSERGMLSGNAFVLIRDVTPEYERERVRRDFVANVSHELKTPLTMIQGAVETLSDIDSAHDDDRRQFEQMIRSHAQRMSAIVEDLLNLARIEQSDSAATTTPTAICPMLSAIIRTEEQLRPDPHASITAACDDDVTWPIDRSLMELAVRNLVNNALAYTPAGGSVCVEAYIQSQILYITVTDTGIGIPAADIPRVFERFYRGDRSRSRDRGGTGLGLSLVQHVARVHGGEVEIDSAVGIGSTFTLKIPGGSQ